MGPLTNVSPTAFQTGLVKIIMDVGMPIGGTIIFLAVCIAAIQIATSKFNPDRRENVYNNLLHVCVGAGILGAALFIASAAFNIGANYFKP